MSRLWDVQYNILKTKRLAVALGLSRSLWGPFKYRERCILVRRRQPLEGQFGRKPGFTRLCRQQLPSQKCLLEAHGDLLRP